MSNGNSDNHLTELEQRQQRQDAVVAQIHEILLIVAQRQERTAAQQERNTQDIADLRRSIADLQAVIRDRYGNGHTPT